MQPIIPNSAALLNNLGMAPQPMGSAESTEQFRELMAHLEQVFWIKSAARTKVIYVSPAYERIWGRSCQSLYDDFQSFADSVHPDDRACMGYDQHKRGDIEQHDEEFRILRPDGEIRWIRSRSYPVRNKQGEIQRFAGIDEDITELKVSEGERSRLVAIVEYSEDALISTSIDGIIINWNHGAERQYGYSAEEILGHSISVLFPADHYFEYLEILKTIKRGETVPSHDAVRQRKDGSLFKISVSFSPIENRWGTVIGASKIGHDLSRIRKIEAQFIEAQKMEVMGRLASGVAHDFNNILSIITGYNDLMSESLGVDHPLLKYTKQIRLASIRAALLTRQLLIFSRKETVEASVISLNDVVDNMRNMLNLLLDPKLEMNVVLGNNLGHIKANEGYIGQVLLNLVVNANDAMPDGGELKIETSLAILDEDDVRRPPDATIGTYVVLCIADTGSGMTDDVKTHLFDAFFTTKSIGHGTGLGLTTCQSIVQQSGGFIAVLSQVDVGTTFTIYFPQFVEETITAN